MDGGWPFDSLPSSVRWLLWMIASLEGEEAHGHRKVAAPLPPCGIASICVVTLYVIIGLRRMHFNKYRLQIW